MEQEKRRKHKERTKDTIQLHTQSYGLVGRDGCSPQFPLQRHIHHSTCTLAVTFCGCIGLKVVGGGTVSINCSWLRANLQESELREQQVALVPNAMLYTTLAYCKGEREKVRLIVPYL